MQLNKKVQRMGIFSFVCIASTYRGIIVKRLSRMPLGIINSSIPTMQSIYLFLVRENFCNSVDERDCTRCSAESGKRSGIRNGSSGEDSNEPRIFIGSCYPDTQSVDIGNGEEARDVLM